MSLYTRLIPQTTEDEEFKIPVHQFMASMRELNRGNEVTRADIIAMFSLTVADEVQLDQIINKGQGLPQNQRFEFGTMLHDALLLAENGNRYTVESDFIARVQRF